MSIASVNYNIINASAPFSFSVKDSNGVEKFVSESNGKIYFTALINGVYTVKISKGSCEVINQINVINCTTVPNTGCSTPILTLVSIQTDKKASFTISNIADCQGMEFQYSENINFTAYFPVVIGCVTTALITFPANAVYYTRVSKTCTNGLLQYSNVISTSTVVGDNNCYTFAGCLNVGVIATSDTYRINLKENTTKNVSFTLSNGSIISILAGSNFGQEIINKSQGCPTVISNTLNIPFCPITPVTPVPPQCVGITNLTIAGANSVNANSTNQYSLSYSGNPPLNYTWGVSGQGTSIVSGGNSDTATIKFGSSGNFILYLDVKDSCGNIISTTKSLTLIPVNNCDIVISNIGIVCNATNSSTVTVTANSPSGKVLRYGVLGFVGFQTSNIFNLPNSDVNGYTFQVVELGNETDCRIQQNRMVSCVPTTPVPPATTCNLLINNVNVVCNSANNATLTVVVSNPSNYVLQYQIDNLITWQDSNVFTGITNNGTGYVVRARNKNNISCSVSKNNVYVDCQNIPTNCVQLTNLVISGNNSVVPNSQNSYTSSYAGAAPYSYAWSISGQGVSVVGGSNASFATFQMGNSNGIITLTVTGCGNPVTTEFIYGLQATPTPTPTSCICTDLNLLDGGAVEAFRGGNNGTQDIITVQVPYDFSSNCGVVRANSYTLNVYNGTTLLGTISESFPFENADLTKSFTVLTPTTATSLIMELSAVCFYGQSITSRRTYPILP